MAPHAQDMSRSMLESSLRDPSGRGILLLERATNQVQHDYGESHGVILEDMSYRRMTGVTRWVVRIRVPQTVEVYYLGRLVTHSGESIIDEYQQRLHDTISHYDALISVYGHGCCVQGIIDTCAKVRFKCS